MWSRLSRGIATFECRAVLIPVPIFSNVVIQANYGQGQINQSRLKLILDLI